MIPLVQYVTETYPSPEHMTFLAGLIGKNIVTWKHFVQKLHDHLASDVTNVYQSTTWGICREYLGFDMSNDEQKYIENRGGTWQLKTEVNLDKVNMSIVTTRD